MSDENLLNLLRDVTVDRTSATSANIRGAAALGKRLRRRRHAAAALGSGLTVAGFVALLTFAAPGGQTVVQGAAPAETSRPSAGSGSASAAPSTAHDENFRLLQKALGATSWDLAYNRTPTGVVTSGPLVQPATGPTGRGLPAGFVADSFVTVVPQALKATCPKLHGMTALVDCRVQHPTAGGTLMITRTVTSPATAPAELSTVTRVTYVRPDQSSVQLWLAVTGWSQHIPTDERAALAWLAAFDNKLTAAATDPGMRSEPPDAQLFPIPTVAPLAVLSTQLTNDQAMRDHLGRAAGWQLVYDLDREGNQSVVVAPLPGSSAAAGLPAGWSAGGEAGLDGGSSCSDGKPIMHCTVQQTPDGHQVDVWHTDFPPTQSNGGDRLQVLFTQQMDDSALVSLGASWPLDTGNAADQKQAIAWLNSWLDKLIAVAQDPALRATSYPTPATTCCGG